MSVIKLKHFEYLSSRLSEGNLVTEVHCRLTPAILYRDSRVLHRRRMGLTQRGWPIRKFAILTTRTKTFSRLWWVSTCCIKNGVCTATSLFFKGRYYGLERTRAGNLSTSNRYFDNVLLPLSECVYCAVSEGTRGRLHTNCWYRLSRR